MLMKLGFLYPRHTEGIILVLASTYFLCLCLIVFRDVTLLTSPSTFLGLTFYYKLLRDCQEKRRCSIQPFVSPCCISKVSLLSTSLYTYIGTQSVFPSCIIFNNPIRSCLSSLPSPDFLRFTLFGTSPLLPHSQKMSQWPWGLRSTSFSPSMVNILLPATGIFFSLHQLTIEHDRSPLSAQSVYKQPRDLIVFYLHLSVFLCE